MKPRHQCSFLHANHVVRHLLSRAGPTSATHGSRPFSTITSPDSPFQPLGVLRDVAVESFREKCFQPEKPSILQRKCFRVLPACSRWFIEPSSFELSTSLNYPYLGKYADTLVPLELTRRPDKHDDETCDTEDSFQRFHTPLSLFLDWTRSAQTQSFNFYLAQCQLSDLPPALREDLPTPDIVSQTGRGDVYDTNIWMGIPPTYTPLHRDPNPNLFVQLAGRKQVRLLSPGVGMRVFAQVRMEMGQSAGQNAAAFRGEEMMQGQERLLLEEAIWGNRQSHTVLYPQEAGYDAILEAGDGLFIPKGWWHSIKGVGDGITASVNWWFR